MTIEEVVRQVVEEVLKRMNPPSESRVVILGKPDDENVAALQRQLDDSVDVSIGSDLTSASRVIIPLLSCTQMADLAVGRATNYRFQQVLIRLLGGQAVEVFEFEYQRFSNTALESLCSLYETYRQTLNSFGLVNFAATKISSNTLFAKAVVTEEDILIADKQGLRTLQLAATTLVTPLARDCANARGIFLEKNERDDT